MGSSLHLHFGNNLFWSNPVFAVAKPWLEKYRRERGKKEMFAEKLQLYLLLNCSYHVLINMPSICHLLGMKLVTSGGACCQGCTVDI